MAWWLAVPPAVKVGTSIYDYYQARGRERELTRQYRGLRQELTKQAETGIPAEERRAFIQNVVGGVRRQVAPEIQRLSEEERARRARALGPGAATSVALAGPTEAETRGLERIGAAAEEATERIGLESERYKAQKREQLLNLKQSYLQARGAARGEIERAGAGIFTSLAEAAPSVVSAITGKIPWLPEGFTLPEGFEQFNERQLFEFGKQKNIPYQDLKYLMQQLRFERRRRDIPLGAYEAGGVYG